MEVHAVPEPIRALACGYMYESIEVNVWKHGSIAGDRRIGGRRRGEMARNAACDSIGMSSKLASKTQCHIGPAAAAS